MLTIKEINQIDFDKESQILKALSNPIRLKMVGLLLNDECCVTDVTNALGISQSTTSQHLGILKYNGIVYPKKFGAKTCYVVDNLEVENIIKILINKYNLK
ncbi:MAG: metalloregulator ArsR/SmtB family transcription factor [Lutibacter sp.]|uniref:ArsR/SmtB family transcription factor n=1 Tax=Lutibacter sp. TaxID=1925666 RepID=UPI00385CE1DF